MKIEDLTERDLERFWSKVDKKGEVEGKFLAEKFKVSTATISKIINKKIWKNVII